MADTKLKKEIEEILTGFQREFDRCDGNYKYNRKPVITKLFSLIKKERKRFALSCLPKEKKEYRPVSFDVGKAERVGKIEGFNKCRTQTKEAIEGK